MAKRLTRDEVIVRIGKELGKMDNETIETIYNEYFGEIEEELEYESDEIFILKKRK